MSRKGVPLLLLCMVTIFLANCNGGEMTDQPTSLPSMKDVPDSAWKKLAQKKIFFGHQSVGYNIIDGMQDLKRENDQSKLSIVKTTDPKSVKPGTFAHAEIGMNGDPESKIRAFAELMDTGLGNSVDIAFFKFCYVDFSDKSNVHKIFGDYKVTMEKLKKTFPGTTFVHVTTPLTCMPSGMEGLSRRAKNLIKKAIGRPTSDLSDNGKREEFNELMRAEYSSKEPIFDLAMVESTLPDGHRAVMTKDGKAYQCLVQEYTNDGGHLNEKGRKIVAEQLLIFLATLSS
jgi:hypothetical protein